PGGVVTIPLHDNAYMTRVARADFPARFVAYDRDGRVIGIQTFTDDGMTYPAPPEAKKSVRELARVKGDGGATAILEAGTPAGGYRCWTISFTDGRSGGGCGPWPSKEKPLLFLAADHVGTDVFVTGQLPPSVDLVTVTLPDGTVAKVAPIEGLVMYAVPSRFVQGSRLFLALHAFDASGKQIDQRGQERQRDVGEAFRIEVGADQLEHLGRSLVGDEPEVHPGTRVRGENRLDPWAAVAGVDAADVAGGGEGQPLSQLEASQPVDELLGPEELAQLVLDARALPGDGLAR